jgi:cation diffusion facilitator family transporter
MEIPIEDQDQKPVIYPECHWCAENIAQIAFWGNVGLFFLKLICGSVGNSTAVLADAIHSAADIFFSVVVYFCLKIGKTQPNEEHPYGRGSIEYLASFVVGISLSVVAGIIIYESLILIKTVESKPNFVATWATIIAICANELMYRHSRCCGERFGSPAMIANAWENRADALSSLAALAGVLGAQAGFPFMDPLGAICVALLLLYTGIKMLRDTYNGALDHSLGEAMENKIKTTANSVPGVQGIASLRTREMGQFVSIDIKLSVSPDINLGEGYEICENVRKKLLKQVFRPAFITVSTVGTPVENA